MNKEHLSVAVEIYERHAPGHEHCEYDKPPAPCSSVAINIVHITLPLDKLDYTWTLCALHTPIVAGDAIGVNQA